MSSKEFSDTPRLHSYDAVVVGSGPNGLAAAICLAREGLSVALFESEDTIGGGMRSKELTLPGYVHDVCSAVHPLGVSSPFFRSLPLREFGLEWVHPSAPLAHPLDDGTAAVMERSVDETAAGLGRDGPAYRRLMGPLAANGDHLIRDLLGPLRIPRFPFALFRFGLKAIRSARGLCGRFFETEQARALFAGNAAHSVLPLERFPTAAVGLVLMIAGHAHGWPVARGGSQRIAEAMGGYFRSLGGEVVHGFKVDSIDGLPVAKAYLLDVSPPSLARIAARRLPEGYTGRLHRYRYGPGVFKVDWALSGPIPWRAPDCGRAGTVHVGGCLEEIAASERACWDGEHIERPFVLVSQQSLFDPSRAPDGRHTGWAYCHVPHGSTVDMSRRIENQVERFAPGFGDCILGRHTMSAGDLERYNPNFVGGDIVGGVQDLGQLFARPMARLVPYATPAKDIFLCSSSTPPGAGVHGMCGYFAAMAAMRRM